MLVQALISVITLAALCGAGIVPMEEGDIQLTASDSDAGNWTANMGDMEVNIEHEHNSGSNANGTWTLKMARTFYKEEEDKGPTEEKTNESSQSTETASTSMPEEHHEFNDDLGAMINSIPVDAAPSKHTYTPPDSYSPDYPDFVPLNVYGPRNMHRMHPPPPSPAQEMPSITFFGRNASRADEQPIQQQSGDNEDSHKPVLDPDNFEYFQGVGWFKLDERAMSWEEAQDACSAVGAHLAVPDTLSRVKVFLKLFQRHPEIPRTAILREQVYVGVSDPFNLRKFITVEGDEFRPDFPIWFTNEPDNAPPGEDCVTFDMEGKTRDVPCSYRLPFFCEKNPAKFI